MQEKQALSNELWKFKDSATELELIRMDSKIFDLEKYHRKNIFMSKENLFFEDKLETLVLDNGKII